MAEIRWTDEQQSAIDHRAGPLRIIAGAGSGKTATMTEHIVSMIRSGYVDSDRIVALTFTNAAADELSHRIRASLNDQSVSVWSGTYHSFGMQIVRDGAGALGLPANPRLFSPAESWLIVRDLLREGVELDHLDVSYGLARAIDRVRDFIDRCKDELVFPGDVDRYIATIPNEDAGHAAEMRDFQRLYAAYEARCRELGGVDYGNQIAFAVRALQADPNLHAEYAARFRVFVVDEYQDTNYAQAVLVGLLSAPDHELRIVGDPNQSIYRFRGAAVDNIQRFSGEFPGVVDVGLTTNFRSHQRILDLANHLVREDSGLSSRLTAQNDRLGPTPLLAAGDRFADEARWIAETLSNHYQPDPGSGKFPSVGVLVRKRKLLPDIAGALDEAGLLYQVLGDRTIFDSDAAQDAIATLEILATPERQLSIVRVLESPRYRIHQRAIFEIRRGLGRGDLLDVVASAVDDPPESFDEEDVASLRRFCEDLRGLIQRTSGLPVEAQIREIRNLRASDLTTFDIEALHQLEQVAARFAENVIDRSPRAFVEYLRAIEEIGAEEAAVPGDVDPDSIALLTVHGAKGLEFDIVVIAGTNANDFGSQTISASDILVPPPLLHNAHVYPGRSDFPDRDEYDKAVKQFENELSADEERRLFYVAITRAREHLYFSWSKQHPTRKRETKIYPLLEEIQHLAVALEMPSQPDTRRTTPVLDFFTATGTQLRPRDEFQSFAEAWREYWRGSDDEKRALAALDEGLTRFREGRDERTEIAARLRDIRRNRQYRPLPPDRYSYSLIDTYERCPRLYLHRYVIGVPGPPVEASYTGLGRRFHEALHQAYIAGGDDQGDGFLRFFESDPSEQSVAGHNGRSSVAATVGDGYLRSGDVNAEVLAVEPEFFLKLGSGPDAPIIYGLIDRVQRRPDGAVEIVDYKTHRDLKSRDEVLRDLQLPIYAMAARESLGYDPGYATMAFVRHGKWFRFPIDELDLDAARNRIDQAVAGILAHDYACRCGGSACGW
ncbi:ATP-dependent DNA helicase [soil metagenome]